MTFDELIEIEKSRTACARQARDGGRLADAKEYELTAALARELIESRERFGAVADKGFLSG